MAEVLGVASGAIGIASFAFQIADSILKLKSLVNRYRDAPEEIRCTLQEVEVLSAVLDEIELRTQNQNTHGNNGPIDKSIRFCLTANERLRSLVKALEAEMTEGKRRGKLKAAMKRESILELRSGLEAAKTSLMLAYQFYTQREMMEIKLSLSSLTVTQVSGLPKASNNDSNVIEAQTQAPALGMAHAEDNGGQQQPVTFSIASPASTILPSSCKSDNKLVRTRTQYTTLWSSLAGFYKYSKVLPLLEYRNTQRQRHFYTDEGNVEDVETVEENSLAIQLPLWLIGRRYFIHRQRATSGWDFKLRSHPVVSKDALIMKFCKNGDLKGVQKLFCERSASPFDADIYGFTALHIAARYGHPHIIQFLLESGADANARSTQGSYTPLLYMRSFDFEKNLRPVQLLVEKGNADATDCDGGGYTAYETPSFGGSDLTWLLDQEAFPLHTLKTMEGYPLWFSYLFGGRTLDHAYKCMPRGQICQEEAQYRAPMSSSHLSIRKGSNILHGVFTIRDRVGSPPWVNFITKAIKADVDIHAVNDRGETPLIILLDPPEWWRMMMGVDFQKAIRRNIINWLEILEKMGFDLVQYVAKEQDLYSHWSERMDKELTVLSFRIGDSPCSFEMNWKRREKHGHEYCRNHTYYFVCRHIGRERCKWYWKNIDYLSESRARWFWKYIEWDTNKGSDDNDDEMEEEDDEDEGEEIVPLEMPGSWI